MIHILDWIIYVPYILMVYKLIEALSDGEFTEELGVLVGVMILIVATVLYCVTFWYYDWINIVELLRDFNITL